MSEFHDLENWRRDNGRPAATDQRDAEGKAWYDHLVISTRTRNVIAVEGIRSLAHADSITDLEYQKMPNLGPKGIRELRLAIARRRQEIAEARARR